MPSILRPPQYGFTDRSLDMVGNSYLNVNNRIVNTQSFSIECMVKPDISGMGSTSGWILTERGSNSGNRNYQLIYNTPNSVFRFDIRVSGSNILVFSTTQPQSGVWYHLAAVCDAVEGKIKLYVNGVEEDSENWSGARDVQNTNFRVAMPGFNIDQNVRYNGEISDIRVWDHARTAEQIKRYSKVPLRGSETGLLAYYPINEGSGNTTEDKTGNGNNLSLIQNPTWIT